MNRGVYDAGFVSTTLLKLYSQVAKITGVINPPPNLRLIGIAIVLARALESIATLMLAGRASLSSNEDDSSPGKIVQVGTFAADVREELVDAIAELERDNDPATEVNLPFVAVLMATAIDAIDLLVGDRAIIERNVEDDAERAAPILLLTTEVFGGAESASNWLCAPSIQFDGHRPLDLLISSRQDAKLVAIYLALQWASANPSRESANA